MKLNKDKRIILDDEDPLLPSLGFRQDYAIKN